jgi:hypothetical protein
MSRGAMRRLGVANLGEDNRRAAQPQGILLSVGTPTVPMRATAPTPGSQEQGGGAKEPAEDTMKPALHSGKAVVHAGAPAPAEPSWGHVLATTIKLWVLRRLPFVGFAQQRESGRQSRNWSRWRPGHLRQLTARRRRLASLVLVLAVAAVAAVQFTSVFTGTASPAARAPSLGHPVAGNAGPVGTHGTSSPAALAAAQAEAAAWIADQVSSDAILACHPVMCAALMAQGVTAGRLLPLRPGTANPVGASVLVTSTSIRSQLTDEYAPALIASFGSGDTRIEVRAAAPGGAAAYESALRADLAARRSAGSQLLRNWRIQFTARDATQIRAGEVDSRLLATLAALASQYPLRVIAFGDASPGAQVLFREVTITSGSSSSSSRDGAARLAGALAMVRAQNPPYQPAHVTIVHSAIAPVGLSIEFAAPSPLGLLTALLAADPRRAAARTTVIAGAFPLVRHRSVG